MSLYKLNKDELILIITKIEENHGKELNLLEQKHDPVNMSYYNLDKLKSKIINEQRKRCTEEFRGCTTPFFYL